MARSAARVDLFRFICSPGELFKKVDSRINSSDCVLRGPFLPGSMDARLYVFRNPVKAIIDEDKLVIALGKVR
jgi:hypothetical protein